MSSDKARWYGGKVQFSGRLKISPTKTPQYIIVLDPPELGASSRFKRRFGSRSVLTIKLPSTVFDNIDGLTKFFLQPFVLLGRVFRSFYAKDNNIFMIQTNELVRDDKVAFPSDENPDGPLSLLGFLNWHNPLKFNSKQVRVENSWSFRYVTLFVRLRINGHLASHLDCRILFQDNFLRLLTLTSSPISVC